MRLSDEQLDDLVRRDMQDATAAWHAPEWRGAGARRAAAARPRPARRRGSLRPLLGVLGVAAVAAVIGVAIARPLATTSRQGATPPAGAGPRRPAGDIPLGLTAGTLAWDAATNRATMLVAGGAEDGETWTWSAATGWTAAHPKAAPLSRIRAAVAADPAGGVLIFGGSYGTEALGDTWRWDGAQWHRLSPAAAPAAGPATMCWDFAAGRLLLVAADTAGTGGAATWTWTGATWDRLGPAPPHAVHLAWDGAAAAPILLTAAGADGAQPGTWAWRGGSWTRVAGAPPVGDVSGSDILAGHVAYDTGSGDLLLVGPSGTLQPETWSWSPSHDWVRGEDVPDQSVGGMVTSPDTGTVLFAGPTTGGAFVHGYRWAGERWLEVPRGA